jgi:PTH2 family peptidyl-tRNA hydrolase
MKVFFDLKKCVAVDPPTLQMTITPEMLWWLTVSFAKICVYVTSEKELLEIYDAALEEGLPRALITDSGKTEFHGVPTNTCIAIGPAEAKKIDVVTGHLPLL